MLRLSEYMAAAWQRPLPPQVNLRAKLHTLDTFAAMVSGSELKPGVMAIRFAREHAGKPEASVAASTVRCSSMDAALANGMLAHADETDDSHEFSTSHPGCSVVPAALAAGEQMGIGGAHFLRAVALGYDVGTRFMPALNFRGRVRARSSHAIVSGFGAAAAAGCAVKLDAQRMRWMLDYACQQSSGLQVLVRDTEHIEKAFAFAGMGARSGVTSAMVVLSGWTGIDDVLSGDNNFFDAYAGEARPSALVDGLGERWEITRTNIKKWTVGSPIQAALDSLEALLKQQPFTGDQVTRVVVRLSSGRGTVNDREMPDINLQHMIALMLADGTATFKSSHDFARMKDPKVLAQKAKVQLVPDPELEKASSRQAIVDVTLTDGRTLSHHTREVRGTVTNPMTEAEIIAKADELMAPILGAAPTRRVIQTVMSLDEVPNIRSVARMLQTRS